ncbi:MAG: hypothetical protein EBZ87_03355 [Microbacteriaceae bacterium]|jgi:hypothetical protein|nr:hypothetical protein [Microbacteriaceae bacterium]
MQLIQFVTEAGHTSGGLWPEAWAIFSDPSHIIAELGWTLIQDVVLIWLLYGTVWKKMILPRLRREIHKEIDEEHNIKHD